MYEQHLIPRIGYLRSAKQYTTINTPNLTAFAYTPTFQRSEHNPRHGSAGSRGDWGGVYYVGPHEPRLAVEMANCLLDWKSGWPDRTWQRNLLEGNELKLASGVGSTMFEGCGIGIEVGTGRQGQEGYRGS